MTHVTTVPHECEGNLIYCDHGLSPYWILGHLLIDCFDGDSGEHQRKISGETWQIRLTYQKGGIKPRPDDRVNSDRLYEYRISAHGHGQRKANFLVQPRFEEMRHYETGDPISSPFDHVDEIQGINVRFAGSNLEPDEYRELLPEFIQGLATIGEQAVNDRYFRGSVHEMSNITTYERYVRLHRSKSQKVVGRTGVMQRLLSLCATEKGSQFEYKVDNQEIVGKNHRVVLPKNDIQQLAPDHRYGKQLKHYHPKHVREKQSDDPLYHPKVGVLIKKSLTGHSVPWNERRRARREIDDLLIGSLSWSGVPVQPDSTTFVADTHFSVRESENPVDVRADPTPEMEANQDTLLVTVLRDLCDSDIEVLESLVADGGHETVSGLANETDRSISTLYRAIHRMDGIVQNDNGTVSFTSKKIQQEIAGIVESTERRIENTADRLSKLLNIELRSAASSAWEKWCRKYGARITSDPSDQRMTVRIDTVLSRLKSVSNPYVGDVLSEALTAWLSGGRDPGTLQNAVVELQQDDGTYDTWTVSKLID